MRAGRAGCDDRVVRAHQAVFDGDLAGDEVDQPPVNEMRADAAGPVLVQVDALFFDSGKAADSRADRDSRAVPGCLVHVGEAGILDRLPGGVDPVNDERVDLALDLVVDPLRRIESMFMVRRLDLAGDPALLVAGIELGDRPGAALRRDDVAPARFDVSTERRHQPQTCHDDTAHDSFSVSSKTNGPPPLFGKPFVPHVGRSGRP